MSLGPIDGQHGLFHPNEKIAKENPKQAIITVPDRAFGMDELIFVIVFLTSMFRFKLLSLQINM